MISDLVIELLELLGKDDSEIETLAASMELVTTLDRPEDLLVHLSDVAQRIIEQTDYPYEEITEPRIRHVHMHAAKLTRAIITLMS